MRVNVEGGAALRGRSRVPGDKSVTHRALMLAAICEGVTEIADPGTGEDNLSTLRCLTALGVDARFDAADHFTVRGRGLHGLEAPSAPLDCGNSGTTARLLAGLLAGANIPATLTGDASLRSRPMRRIADPLCDLGYDVRVGEGGRLPMEIVPITPPEPETEVPSRAVLTIASAQVKSAILLSGLYRSKGTEVVEPACSRDHTERLLRALGVRCGSSGHYGQPLAHAEAERLPTVALHPPSGALRARRLEIPGDPSSAAFLLAAGLLSGGEVTVERMGVSPTRSAFLGVLERMGGVTSSRNRATLSTGEPVADVCVTGALSGDVVIAGAEVPLVIDEIPLLAVVGAASRGRFEVRDARELRVKESDRIARTVALLRALGVSVEEREDGFGFEGLGEASWGGFAFDAQDDHRLAMSAVVAGLAGRGAVSVEGADCIAVSYPSFVETLVSLGGRVVEVG